MRNVVRPIAFDEKRKQSRRDKARTAQRRRRDRQFEFGGKWYLHNFMIRMVREPWRMTDEANDNESN